MSSITTRVLPVDPAHPSSETISAAADVIRAGGLVAFPTETVYGLGANALDTVAVARIFEAKRRPASDPLIVHIASIAQLSAVALDIPDYAHSLTAAFWPGPLTLALRRHPAIPSNVSAGRDAVAVRMPNHPVALALIEAAQTPIAAPSANLFSRPSPTTAQHVLDDLDGRIDMILDGGPTTIGVESTVIDLTVTPPRLLRPGGVSLEALREHLPDLAVDQEFLAASDVEVGMASPGMLAKHYSPRAPLLLFSGPTGPTMARMRQVAAERVGQGQRVGLLVNDEDVATFENVTVAVFRLGPAADLGETARRLFAGLRELDGRGVDVILARVGEAQTGLARAIRDRLLRAAEGMVIDVKDGEAT